MIKAEIIEPFVRAAMKVIESVTGVPSGRGDLSLRKTPFTTQEITVIAGVTGDIEGTVLYGMSHSTAQSVASAMIGAPVDMLDEMATSAVSEIANMITGNAITILSEKGFDLDLTPPSIVRGTNIQVCTKAPTLVVPVQTDLGSVELNVSLADNLMRKAA